MLVVGRVVDEVYVILTPDLDIYCEDYSGASPDIAQIRDRPAGGGAPLRIRTAQIYSFAVRPNVGETAQLVAEGNAEARRERMRRGLPAAGAPGALVAAGALVVETLLVVLALPLAVVPLALFALDIRGVG